MSAENPRKKIGVALFGAGRAGTIHAKNLAVNRRVAFRWIVEENREVADRLVKEMYLEDTKVISSKDVDKVWNDASTDAVLVCTPTHLHEGIILSGLSAGKAVFCEKPIAAGLSKIKDCYQLAEKKGKPLLCAFNRRFDPSIQSLKERIKLGDVGQVQCIKSTARDAPFPPVEYLKISGGIYHDCGVHDIDLICWLLEEEPITIFAQGHAFHPEIAAMNDVDQVAIVLKFPSGVIATVDLSREAVFGYDQRLEVFGSKGMLQTQNRIPAPITRHSEIGATLDPIFPSFPERYSESYAIELNHFLDAVEGKVDHVVVSMDDTIRTTRIADLCEESAHEGKMVKYTPPVY